MKRISKMSLVFSFALSCLIGASSIGLIGCGGEDDSTQEEPGKDSSALWADRRCELDGACSYVTSGPSWIDMLARIWQEGRDPYTGNPLRRCIDRAAAGDRVCTRETSGVEKVGCDGSNSRSRASCH